jgi:dolichyl-phosphate beta-glucosyltransferase
VTPLEQQIVLVTPVWNDSTRLEVFGPKLARALAESGLSVRWVVADDGSSLLEQGNVAALVECLRVVYPQVEAMFFPVRSRKGGAIYQAWDAWAQADFLAFVDADGAIDAASTIRLLRRCCELEGVAVVGIRHDSAESLVSRPWLRRVSFRLFALLVQRLVGVDCSDTQCGVKVLPGTAYRAVSSQLIERGFVFDVELLLVLVRHGVGLEQRCIPWNEMAGGKVHPVRDAWGMIAGVWRIRQRLKAGAYGPERFN